MPSFTLGTSLYSYCVFIVFCFFLRSGVLHIWHLFFDVLESYQGLGIHSFESLLSACSRYGKLQCILVKQVLKDKLCISSVII